MKKIVAASALLSASLIADNAAGLDFSWKPLGESQHVYLFQNWCRHGERQTFTLQYMITATGERRAIDHIESSIGPWYRVTWKDKSQAPVEYSIVGAGRGADGGERLTIALEGGLPWHPCRPSEGASLDNSTQQETHGDPPKDRRAWTETEKKELEKLAKEHQDATADDPPQCVAAREKYRAAAADDQKITKPKPDHDGQAFQEITHDDCVAMEAEWKAHATRLAIIIGLKAGAEQVCGRTMPSKIDLPVEYKSIKANIAYCEKELKKKVIP
jgi:hypothetical protein